MAQQLGDLDHYSDELIETIVDQNCSNLKRNQASKALFDRHSAWVNQQIGRRVFNPDDIQDIAQSVWMMVLQPDKLGKDYTDRSGRFRAYLRAPIRWSILKHIDKLPFSLNDEGKKVAINNVDITDTMLEQGIDSSILQDVIENIVKPNLINVDTKSRNIYVLNEHSVIFETDPTLQEAASINGLQLETAEALHAEAIVKSPDTCTEEELSVFIPVEYRSFIDTNMLEKSSGRYLANVLGVTEAVFRKRLHTARKYLLETVRANLPTVAGS